MNNGTLGQEMTPESALCSLGRGPCAGVVSACFIELLNKPRCCLAPSHGEFSGVKLHGKGPWGNFSATSCTVHPVGVGCLTGDGTVLGFFGDAGTPCRVARRVGWFSICSGRTRLEQVRLFSQFIALAGEVENPKSCVWAMGLWPWVMQMGRVHLARNPGFSLRCQSLARMTPVESRTGKRAELGTNTSMSHWRREGLYGDALGMWLGWPVRRFWAGGDFSASERG